LRAIDEIAVGPIFICVGEPSGDLYGGFIARELRRKNPDLEIYGVGGDGLQRSGVKIIEGYTDLQTFGFSAGLSSFLRNCRIYRQTARALYQIKPKVFIAVAYPGKNLLLCRYARKLGIRTYFFSPPQIWAWGEFRKYFIKRWVERAISFFPFEYNFYKSKDLRVEYFENPLLKGLKKYQRRNFKRRIGFMPGSRRSEIKRNLPIMIRVMERFIQKRTDVDFLLIADSQRSADFFRTLMAEKEKLIKAEIVVEERYQMMKDCEFLIVSSGTASFEALIMQVPQAFFNRPSFFDYYAVRRFLKINEYNLANLYSGKPLIPTIISRNSEKIVEILIERLLSCF